MKHRGGLRGYLRNIVVNGIGSSVFVPRPARYALYRAAGLQLRSWNIAGRCFIGGRNLTIGRHCFINYGCSFDTLAAIDIGEGCRIGMETMICTSTHDLAGPEQRGGPLRAEPVRVGRGVWIGARVTVLPGVTIGDGCVIAAGSVVTNDCKPDSLYAGIPARRVRDLSADAFADS